MKYISRSRHLSNIKIHVSFEFSEKKTVNQYIQCWMQPKDVGEGSRYQKRDKEKRLAYFDPHRQRHDGTDVTKQSGFWYGVTEQILS